MSTENPPGSLSLTLPSVSDDSWPAGQIRWEVLAAHERPAAAPAGCNDVFDPQLTRTAVVGSSGAGAVILGGLANGMWSVSVVAEDGSGRRSPPTPPVSVTIAAGAVAFDPTVRKILDDRCAFAGCHAGANPPGFFDLAQPRAAIVAYQTKAPGKPVAVEPYCLSGSYLWWKIEPGFPIDGGLMPPHDVDTPALSRRERALIESWIEQGAN